MITLSKPFSDFPRALAGIYYPINPRSKAAGNPSYWTNPLSAGPFKIKKWVVGSDEFVIEANPNYWAKVSVQEVRFLAVPDPVTRVLAVKQGTIDYAFDLPASIARSTLKDKNSSVGSHFSFRETSLLTLICEILPTSHGPIARFVKHFHMLSIASNLAILHLMGR